MDFFGFICLAFNVGWIALCFYAYKMFQERKEAYYGALEQLKDDPHNPELRQKVLHLGREFIKCNYKKFNETMLTNDINAACARAGSEVSVKPDKRKQLDQKPSIEERLDKLDDLRAKGFISDAEHMARRQDILDEI